MPFSTFFVPEFTEKVLGIGNAGGPFLVEKGFSVSPLAMVF